MLNIFKKLLGSHAERVIKSYQPLLTKTASLESQISQLTDQDLRAQTVKLREQLEKGASLSSIQAEAFATVREAGKRVLNMRHFDVQIIGGAVLNDGRIAEMRTGEGKTLVATLPAYLNALRGKGVHIVTVNDYLAKRDAGWMGEVFRFLGLTVGCLYHDMPLSEKKEAYKADITYGQNNEFGFDYLRDNMKHSRDEMVQRGHNFAIIDEVDSILIDEARTPLIISGATNDSVEMYYELNSIPTHFTENEDYTIDLKSKTPSLTENGIHKVEELLKIENLYDPNHTSLLHHVVQALKAHTMLIRDQDYVVQDGEVIIVDEFTGRLMPGRRWSNGLHQAVEAKEGVEVQRENRTLASITFQNYFRMYKTLSGMTGTADTEALEFQNIYGLQVIPIPTNMPLIRKDLSDIVYKSRHDKISGVVADIKEIHETKQPILVGTVNIEQSEVLSRELAKVNVPHRVLNAKFHAVEAEIVAQAGRLGAVTIATNMAGRGTDILLGGNAEFLARAKCKEDESLDYQETLKECQEVIAKEREQVRELGGLFIIGTERHESRRIDNQLRGRAGRQGDPGASQFYISFEDDLMRRFAGDKTKVIMSRLGWNDGESIDGSLVSSTIKTAQMRVEGMHYESRKYVTDYDDVMNKQRTILYKLRMEIIDSDQTSLIVEDFIGDIIEAIFLQAEHGSKNKRVRDLKVIKDCYQAIFLSELNSDKPLAFNELFAITVARYYELRKIKEEKITKLKEYRLKDGEREYAFDGEVPSLLDMERRNILETIDEQWLLHLQVMDELREGIGFRGYAQKNPLYEYQQESLRLFKDLIQVIKEGSVRSIFAEEVVDIEEVLKEYVQFQQTGHA